MSNEGQGDDPALQSLVVVSDALRSGRLSSVRVTESVLAHAHAAQRRTNCFLHLDDERALDAAHHADRRSSEGVQRGLLHGIPLAHKDMFETAGQIVRYGSRVRGDHRATGTATVIERLAAAGAFSIGELNMSEFALGPTGQNASWGDCCNAIDPDYIAGGSSSGSAVAVASGAAFGALGSDTGGSVRIPAAANGIVGLKPTYGLVPRSGAMKLSPSIDVVGPLTRTVGDCARLLGVVAGFDARDPLSSRRAVDAYEAQLTRGVDGLRIGVPRNYFNESLTDDVRAAVEHSLGALQAQGAHLVDVAIPDVQTMSELSRVIVYAEAAALHAYWLRTRPELYSPQVRLRLSTGTAIPASIYLEALLLRMPLLRRFVSEVFSRCDVLHTATLPAAVPKRSDVDFGAGPGVWQMMSQLVRCTAPINYLGLPALAVPAQRLRNGHRASVQLIGRPFSESVLLRCGVVQEAALRD